MGLPPLSEWESFYVIIGSSAAALTGLQFVVIALSPETRVPGDETGVRTFATPTIVHFSAVLLMAAFMSTPHQTLGSLRLCFLGESIAGLAYLGWVIRHTRHLTAYIPQLEDWIWHAMLPAIAYVSVFIAALVLGGAPETGLYIIEAAALLLLFVGIHNAWDTAVWMTMNRRSPNS